MHPFSPPGHVLVVDDLPTNVKLLATILKLEGFRISTAGSGIEALQFIENAAPDDSPDVVLLDVMMPEMDGFETCQRIRNNPATLQLPVVMVTALRETFDRVKALDAGADDFLTKPVEEIEVIARVKSLVRAKRGRDELERAYAELRRAEELRESLTQMLVHDLRTPLTAVLVSLDMLGRAQTGALNPSQKELVAISTRGGGSLLALINDLLDVAKLESGQMNLDWRAVSIEELAENALREVAPLVGSRDAQIERHWAPNLVPTLADTHLVKRVLVNLLSNALKFSPLRSTISIGAHQIGSELQFWVRDNGYGIAPEHQKLIWDKFGQAEARRKDARVSTGLGLTFCKLVVEAHGGVIGLDSEVGKGSTFYFSLPLKPIIEDEAPDP
ncbi:MAG TPA: response regulator [Abditibacterium sp.]